MQERQSSLSLFHFLFSELIEECYGNSKEGERLKKIGSEIGFKLYTQICLKRGINERPSTLNGLMKNVQTKVFKFLFNYEASRIETYETEGEKSKTLVYGIVYF